MNKPRLIKLSLLFILIIQAMNSAFAQAAEQSKTYSNSTKKQIYEKLTKTFPELKGIKLEESESVGVYQFWSGGKLIHVYLNGKHLMMGELYDVDRSISLAQEARGLKIQQLLAALNKEKMIIYAAEKQQREITIFTDVDCHFCRKLHKEISKLTNAGVTVRYLAFPVFSQDIPKHISVWCSNEPKVAMTLAKNGQSIDRNVCKSNVQTTLKLGLDLGFEGTPQIVYDNGEVIGNYISAEQIIEDLDIINSLQ